MHSVSKEKKIKINPYFRFIKYTVYQKKEIKVKRSQKINKEKRRFLSIISWTRRCYHWRDHCFRILTPPSVAGNSFFTIEAALQLQGKWFTHEWWKKNRDRAAVNPEFMKRGEGRLFADALKTVIQARREPGNAYCLPDVDRNEISLRLLPPTRRIRIKLACQTYIFLYRRGTNHREGACRARRNPLSAWNHRRPTSFLPLSRPRET